MEAIHTYIEDSKKVKRQNDALFVGENGRRLSPRRVEQIIGECLKSAGLSGKGYTPHKLRHTAATLMYQYGNVDVRILKEILGHANLNTTELYTHISNRQLEQAADSSPLAQKKRVRKAKTDDTSEE
ncbi:Tyrosine recombinase XerC [bioreactor metagenome]|uniref:Tyrosine recombinase XerC n=1 Tax=bioreactor metagenome TaxID=1076179 RepID=A0A645JPX1_9ZZZZ